MDNDLDLSAVRAFRSVAREGSFSNAARALRVPKSTVSKRVRDLEDRLGVRLIERTTRQLRLTAEGEVLVARADRLLSEAEDIRRALSDSGSAPRGHLRIAVPQMFGQLIMGRVGAALRARHPDITLECVFLDRPPDMLEEGFDGVLRVGPLEDSSHGARRLGEAAAVLVAPPGLQGLADLQEPEDIARFPVVGVTPAYWGSWDFVRASDGASRQVVPVPALSLGSALAIREAVMAGAGLSLLPYLLVGPDLQSGRLIRLLPEWEGNRKEISFVYPSPQSATARLRAFIDVLVEELRNPANAWIPVPPTKPGRG
ncbi:LysR family transcriptional regulator [Frigidibacter sp.]|uniref:LysR family transcriptional regulator n=1 Tax=Frigidibacter sp. TaxID=2586418 RepID=UPI002736F62F|nr:LysR family transcriptional regulator [Frigidibacter sp.]MDP3339694.1 LysR substrate-binding domain-containing protein [Frigidibacter sp.]